jgi:hypothetical protein
MLASLGYALAYSVLGIGMLGLGFFALDLLTPGRLAVRIWEERSINAAIVLASGFIGLGAITFTAIWTNATSGFGSALLWTAAFGIAGVILQAVAFVLLDVITPGKLGDVICERAFHPASLVTAASQLAVSVIIVASMA